MAELLTQAAYARHLGVSPQAVNEALKRGRIVGVKQPDGKLMIDPGSADAQWKRRRDPDQYARGVGSDDDDGSSLVEEKTRSERLRADLLEIDLAEKRGELVVWEDVEKALADKFAAARDELLSLPSRVAPMLAAESSIGECMRILDAAIRQSMRHLSAIRPPVVN